MCIYFTNSKPPVWTKTQNAHDCLRPEAQVGNNYSITGTLKFNFIPYLYDNVYKISADCIRIGHRCNQVGTYMCSGHINWSV